MATVTIPLAHPVIFDEVRHDSLTIRPAKRRDLRALPHGAHHLETGVALAARLAGVPVAVIYALDDDDAGRVASEVDRLLAKVL